MEAIAKRMLADQEEIFIWWHMFRDREIDRQCLRAGTAVPLARFKYRFTPKLPSRGLPCSEFVS